MTSLASRLVASANRVVPFEVPRAYRDVPSQSVDVVVVRRASCSRCSEAGCAHCEFVGWVVARNSVTVDVPIGAAPGSRMRIEGAGDVLDGEARSIEFELVGAGTRANELRFAENDFATKLDTAWAMERDAKARPRRRRKRVAVGAASVLLLVLLVRLVVGLWAIRTAGAPCTDDSTCWSGMCSGNTCVTECKTSRECPSDMWCAPVGPRSTCLPRHN